MPDYELLDAIAITFGKLAVHDAHRQVGLFPPETIHGVAGESYDLPAMGWRFPCMIAHELPRSRSFALSDGAKIEFEEKPGSRKITSAEAAEYMTRFDADTYAAMGRQYNNYNELAAGYFTMVRSAFLKDHHHQSMLFLFRNMAPTKFIQTDVENVQQKVFADAPTSKRGD